MGYGSKMDYSNKILIITGGNIDYIWAGNWLKERKYDYCIVADSGLMHADKLGVKVDFILGDYDSVDTGVLEEYKKNTDVVKYPAEKDFTDTHLAIIKALQNGADRIDIIGATGSRFDHAMTNIFNMKAALDSGVECNIYDKYNKIYLIDEQTGKYEISKENQYGKYVSFIPMTENVKLSLSGFKYELNDYDLKQGLSICQSNEVSNEVGTVNITKGIVVAFETRD